MIREFGKGTMYVDGKEIGQIESASMEVECEEISNRFYTNLLDGYSGEITIDPAYLETPALDDRIGSNILPKYFKSITLGKTVYGRISRSLDKLGVKK